MPKITREYNEGQIGFIQGILFAATLMASYDTNSLSILEEADITVEEIIKYGAEADIEVLKIHFDTLPKS